MSDLINKVKIAIKTGFFHIFGSSVVNKIIAFLSSVVLVRILSKEEYGVFTYAWNIYSIVVLFNGMGMDTAILQLGSEKNQDRSYIRRTSNYCLRFGLMFDMLLAVVLLLIGFFIPLKIKESADLFKLLCLLPMLSLMFHAVSSNLRAEKRNKEYSSFSIINTILVFASCVVGSFLLREKGMVLGYYFAYASTVLISVFAFKIKLFSNDRKPEKKDRKEIHSVAFVSMCNNGLSQLLYLLDIFVLGMIDPQETVLANYRVATIIPSALSFIPLSLITYIYPYFAEHRNDPLWCLKRYRQVLVGLGAFNAFVSLSLCLLAPVIIEIIFGKEYLDVVPLFRLLSVNYFFSGTFRVLGGNLLVTQRKLKFNFMVAVVSGITNIVADILFVNWWGATGAAFATIIVVILSGVLNTSYLFYIFKRPEKSRKGPKSDD